MTTVQVHGDDIMMAVHVARIVGGIVTTFVVGLLLWWAVRTPRRVRARREARAEEAGASEDLWRLLARMEDRLEVLERAMADQVEGTGPRAARRDGLLAPAEEGRDSGRTE